MSFRPRYRLVAEDEIKMPLITLLDAFLPIQQLFFCDRNEFRLKRFPELQLPPIRYSRLRDTYLFGDFGITCTVKRHLTSTEDPFRIRTFRHIHKVGGAVGTTHKIVLSV